MTLFEHILIEGRVQDFQKLLSSKFNSEYLQRIINRDTSKNHKNLMWIGKILNSDSTIDIEELMDNLDIFNKIAKTTDLYQFNEYGKFLDFLRKKSTEVKMGKLQQIKANSRTIADTKRYQVVAPTSHDASKYFGGGTNWCISTSNDHYWTDHYHSNTIIMIKDRYKKPDDPLFKIALVGDASGQFYSSRYDERIEKIKELANMVDFWNAKDQRLSKYDAKDYLSNLPEDLVDDILDYFEGDDIAERKYGYFHDLAVKKFDADGEQLLLEKLYRLCKDLSKGKVIIDDDVGEEEFNTAMTSLFSQEIENGNWHEFLRELWMECILEQSIDDDDFYPDVNSYNIKRLVDRTNYNYDDFIDLAQKSFGLSEDFIKMDDIIKSSLKRSNERIDPYETLIRHTEQMFPTEKYNGILLQSLQMYNKKYNPGFFQGQQSLRLGNAFAGIVNKFVPRNIDELIKVLSINPKATDMVNWIQRYRKDLYESNVIRYKDFFKKC